MTNIKKPRGTLDILPAETRAWRYVEDMIRKEAAASGFEEIRFPTFESTELFDRGVGGTTDIVQKEMYTFTDRDGRSLSLRPEGTAGVARSVIENGLYAGAMPLKLYYLTNFFRYEKPQAGRSREFFQFGTWAESPCYSTNCHSGISSRLHIHAGITHVQHFFFGYFGNFQNIEYNGWIGFNLYPFTLPEHSGKMDFRKIMVNQLLGGCLIFVGSHSNLNTCIL